MRGNTPCFLLLGWVQCWTEHTNAHLYTHLLQQLQQRLIFSGYTVQNPGLRGLWNQFICLFFISSLSVSVVVNAVLITSIYFLMEKRWSREARPWSVIHFTWSTSSIRIVWIKWARRKFKQFWNTILFCRGHADFSSLQLKQSSSHHFSFCRSLCSAFY